MMGRHIPLVAVFFFVATMCSLAQTVVKRELFRDVGRTRESSSMWKNLDVSQFDEKVSDSIASNVLQFAYNIGKQLGEKPYTSKCEVFSPLSVMSALALLMLGAKGKSYQQLKQLFDMDYNYVSGANMNKFHEEFGYMIEDLHKTDGRSQRNRKNANWRNSFSNVNNQNRGTASKMPFEHTANVATGLFTQIGYSLNNPFRNAVDSIYHTDLLQLDFHHNSSGARNEINSWVSNKTFGKIPFIVDGEISKSTNIIIASALYFKGFWENSFFEKATVDDNFYPDGLQHAPIRVKMMATGGVFPFYNSIEYDCRIIGLPYKGNVTTMYVIQPNDSNRIKLRELQNLMDASKFEEIISRMEKKTAVLSFPKMHFAHNFNMKNFLCRMGITDIFNSKISNLGLIASNSTASSFHTQLTSVQSLQPDQRFILSRSGEAIANAWNAPAVSLIQNAQKIGSEEKRQSYASQIDDKRNTLQEIEHQRHTEVFGLKSDLFVEDILHKIDIDVNEFGTEAAAATLTYLRRSGTDVLFRAETPFLILIRHDPTKLVLFYGIINEPEL